MNQKRQILAQLYSSKWVAGKSDAQVLAIFKRLQSEGRIKI